MFGKGMANSSDTHSPADTVHESTAQLPPMIPLGVQDLKDNAAFAG